MKLQTALAAALIATPITSLQADSPDFSAPVAADHGRHIDRQLDGNEQRHYLALFRAIDQEQWGETRNLLAMPLRVT